MLARIIKNILSISVNDVEVKRLFNQNRDIFHYRRERLQTKIIEILIMLHMHTDWNSSDTDAISNINNDSKLNDRNSKNESKNDFRDIDVFVKTNLNNESNVFFDNNVDNLMKKNLNLNNANVFKNNEFDDIENENSENLFVRKKNCVEIKKYAKIDVEKKKETLTVSIFIKF